MKNKILQFLPILLALSMIPAGVLAAKKNQPNFIILLGDDISAVSFGLYGADNPFTSPNIDQLARESFVFNNMFVSEAICAPVRAELYTGLQPVRNGCFQNHKATNEGTKSVVHYLSELGYRVGLAGKKHYKPASVYPFEYIQGFPQDCNLRNQPSEDWKGVKEFASRDEDQPFCLYLCSIHAHSPWDSGDPSPWKIQDLVLPPHFVDTRETRHHFREYLAEVALFDGQVGKTLAMMKELGIDENTVFIILDENGTGMPGGKWTSYDWGVRSAGLIRWPERIKTGIRSDAIAQYCDILPTLIDAAGGKVPAELDGRSMLDLISGDKNTHRDHAFFVHNNGPDGPTFPIRAVTDGRFKLIWNLLPDSLFGVRTINGFDYNHADKMLDRPDHFIYLSWVEKAKTDPHAQNMVERFRKHPEFELYDLDADPWEMNNLGADPDYNEVMLRLKSSLDAWMKQQGDNGADLDFAELGG